MSIKILKTPKLRWINIEEINQESLEYLKQNFKFHLLDYKDITGLSRRSKLDIYKDYIFVIFHFPKLDEVNKNLIVKELYVFLGKDYLITIQKKRFRSLKQYFYRTLSNIKYKKEFSSLNPGYLLYQILLILFGDSFGLADQIGNFISEIEKEIYSKSTKNVMRDLALLRRNILNFRRLIEPQRLIVAQMVNIKKKLFSKDLTIYFDDVRDALENLWVILENYKDIIDGLYHTNESLISDRTNKVIKILTFISVALLPMTLLAGIYGMNIKGLPFAEHPSFIWFFFGILSLIIISVLVYFYKKGWL